MNYLKQLAELRGTDQPIDMARRIGGSLEFKSKAAEPDNSGILMRIAGYASTTDVDSYNEVVLPDAFKGTMASFMEFPIMLFGHDWYDKPIGKWTNYKITERGLYVEGEIYDTTGGRDVATLIENDILKALSIGFSPINSRKGDEPGDPTVIDELALWEISVVNIPANRASLFEAAKAKGISCKSITPPAASGTTNRSNHMEIKDLTAQLAEMKTQAEASETELRKKYQEAAEMVATLQEKMAEVKAGTVPRAEYDKLVENMKGDFIEIKDLIEGQNRKMEARAKIDTCAADVIDTKSAFMTFTKDNGKPLEGGDLRIRQLLQTPINDPTSEKGEQIMALRQAHDMFVAERSMRKFYALHGQGRYNGPDDCQTFGIYSKLLDVVDPSFKAMYSTGTNVGDEWVPTIMSGTPFDEVKMDAPITSLFPVFDMPSNPATWPVGTTLPTVYIAAEASANNPDQFLKSTRGTDNVTFTATKMACVVPVSDELIQDSYVNVAMDIGSAIRRAIGRANDSAILNGDTTATHRDTAAGYTSASPEAAWMGLRFIAYDRSATDSTGAAGGLAATELRAARAKLSDGYKNASDLTYITTYVPYFEFLGSTEVTSIGTYGATASYRDGDVFRWDGSPLYVTDLVADALSTAGLYTSGTASMALVVNTSCFRVGMRKDVMIEFARDPLTGSNAFIGSYRMDFQTLCPTTTVKPVAMAVNL